MTINIAEQPDATVTLFGLCPCGVVCQLKYAADEQQHDKLNIVKVAQRRGCTVRSIDWVTLSRQDI